MCIIWRLPGMMMCLVSCCVAKYSDDAFPSKRKHGEIDQD